MSTPMKFLLTVSWRLSTAMGHKVAVNGDSAVIAVCNIATLCCRGEFWRLMATFLGVDAAS